MRNEQEFLEHMFFCRSPKRRNKKKEWDFVPLLAIFILLFPADPKELRQGFSQMEQEAL